MTSPRITCRPYTWAAVLLVLLAAIAHAQETYKVTFSNPGAMGLVTDCDMPSGYLLARPVQSGTLHSDGTLLDPDGTPGPDLFIRVLTDIPWTRKYDAGQGLAGVFNTCHGETSGVNGYSGNLFIYFETKKGKPTLRILWHCSYYKTPGNVIREHFTVRTANVPIPAWSGGTLSVRASVNLDVEYFLKEGNRNLASYVSITGGTGRTVEFDILIEKLT